jgi:hypothetical protein
MQNVNATIGKDEFHHENKAAILQEIVTLEDKARRAKKYNSFFNECKKTAEIKLKDYTNHFQLSTI